MPPGSDTSLVHQPSVVTPAVLTPLREQVIEALSGHFAADRLPMEEFERRVTTAYAAATPAELQALVADLQLPEPSGATSVPAVAADALRVAPSSLAEQSVQVLLGNHERGGALTVPARLNIRCVLGNVELDLRDATFTAPVTEIVADAVLGNIELTMPAGVRVESHGSSILGSFASTGGGDPAASVLVRLTGSATLASVEIHHAPTSQVKLAVPAARDADATALPARTDPQRLLP